MKYKILYDGKPLGITDDYSGTAQEVLADLCELMSDVNIFNLQKVAIEPI